MRFNNSRNYKKKYIFCFLEKYIICWRHSKMIYTKNYIKLNFVFFFFHIHINFLISFFGVFL
jgi:hypothetical protein